jgi:hypothetical protein
MFILVKLAKWWTACRFWHPRYRVQTFVGDHSFGLHLKVKIVCFYNEDKSVNAAEGNIGCFCQDLKYSAWKNAELWMLKLSVKVKVVLGQAMKTQSGSRGRAVPLNFGPRWSVGGQRHYSTVLSPRKSPFTHYTEDWMCSWSCLDCCGKSRPHQDSIRGLSIP